MSLFFSAPRLAGSGPILNTDQLFTAVPIPGSESGVIGVAWADVNNDGYPDLFLVPNVYPQGGRLFINNKNGTFTQATSGPLTTNASGFGAAFADYDNDGNLDLVVGAANFGNYLYHGNGTGAFPQVTSGGLGDASGNMFYPAWSDYDHDGYVDLFVANGFSTNYGRKAVNSLFHNNGDGTFTRVVAGILVNDTPSFSQCAAWGDYDNDGLPDLFVANSRDLTNNGLSTSFLYHNLGHGQFSKITTGPLVGTLAGLNSAAWADYDNDGFLDLFVCGDGNGTTPQKRTLYHNNGNGTFTEATLAGGIDSDADFDQGCAWADYDNDGYLDLFITSANASGGRKNSLYHNNGDGTFTRIALGALVNGSGDGAGCAWADVNNDGFPDLFVGKLQQWATEPNAFYLNKGNSNNWIEVKLIGTVSNRAAIGAKVRIHATIGGKAMWQMREISGGTGLASQSDLRAMFGLGDATSVDQMRIEWPSGIVQTLTNIAAKQILAVTEAAALPIPTVATGPKSQTLNTGSTGVFSAVITGAPTYQWQLNGVNLSDSPGGTTSNGISGSAGPQLVITNATSASNGNYTVVATNASGQVTTTPAAFSVVTSATPGYLINISARAFVSTGDAILIGGFYIVGSTSRTVLIQALGPALSGQGVSGVLQHPALSIHDSTGATLYANTGWGSSQVLLNAVATAFATALAPNSADSEALLTLPPGGYTAEIQGADGGTGVALCAIYQLP